MPSLNCSETIMVVVRQFVTIERCITTLSLETSPQGMLQIFVSGGVNVVSIQHQHAKWRQKRTDVLLSPDQGQVRLILVTTFVYGLSKF